MNEQNITEKAAQMGLTDSTANMVDWRLKMRTDSYYYLVFQGATLLGGFRRKYEANRWLKNHPSWTKNDLNLVRVKGDDITRIEWD